MNQLTDQIRAQKLKCCPKNHELIQTNTVSLNRALRLSKKYGWSENIVIFCDICNTTILHLVNRTPKKPYYTCEECSFDLCDECFLAFT